MFDRVLSTLLSNFFKTTLKILIMTATELLLRKIFFINFWSKFVLLVSSKGISVFHFRVKLKNEDINLDVCILINQDKYWTKPEKTCRKKKFYSKINKLSIFCQIARKSPTATLGIVCKFRF